MRFIRLSFREPLRTEDITVFYNIGKMPKIMNYYSMKRSFSVSGEGCSTFTQTLCLEGIFILDLMDKFIFVFGHNRVNSQRALRNFSWVCVDGSKSPLHAKQIHGLCAEKDSATEISFQCFCGTHQFLRHTHQTLMAGGFLPGAQAILSPHTDAVLNKSLCAS